MSNTNTRIKTTLEVGVDERQVRALGQTMERTFDPAMIEAFGRSLERLDRTIARLSTSLDKMAKAQATAMGGGGGAGSGGGAGGGRRGKEPGFFGRMGSTAVGTAVGGAWQRGQAGAAQMASGSGFIGGMVSGIPLIGPAMGGAVQGINNFYGQYAQQQQAVLGQFGRTGIGNRGMGGMYDAGAKYGMGPGAVAGAMGNYANQTGLSGTALAGAAPELMRLQQTMGLGSAGAVLGGAGAAGGKVKDPAQMLEDAIASGFQTGIRESRMDQYLAQLGGWTESVRNQGIDLSLGTATALVATMGNLGQRGQAGVRMAQNFQGAMSSVGQGSGFGQIAVLRAAGLGKGRNFMQARVFAEKNPQVILQKMGAEIARNGGSASDMGLQYETVMRSLGVNMSASASSSAGTALKAGIDISSMSMGQLEAGEFGAARGKGVEGAGVRNARAQASLERQGQGVGAGLAGTAIDMRKQEMRLAKTVLPKFALAVEGAVDALGQLITAFEGGGLRGLTKAVATMSVKAQSVIVEVAGDAFSESTFGKEGLRNADKNAHMRANIREAPVDPNREVLRMEMGKGKWKGWQVPVYADEAGGSAQEELGYHLRKGAEAAEKLASESHPSDNQLGNTPN